TMTLFLSLSGTLTGALNSLAGFVPGAIGLTTAAGRLMAIVEMPEDDYSKRDIASDFLEKNRQNGVTLSIRDISYTYKTGTKVFSNASFEAHPHEIIGLVGPSGEGKTTMLRLLLSLLKPQDGAAYIEKAGGIDSPENGTEGVDYMPLSPSTRQFFSYVPQGNTLFYGTIAENLRSVKPDASDEELLDALRLSCSLEFVDRLPEKMNTMVKERGGGFSEGQAQRLSIARALLRKSPILLLDEASSALDVATERRVLKNIMEDTYPRVCIVTTHRPTVLNMCTRVYAISEKSLKKLTPEEVEVLIRDF
ncbi:MAG: ATP-binding cassette domain-containing protein, partial [Lachnospiraceae bacterium]|nr:ATP-binding cassette domain-containing protein [Lachnospiraceae bacterium]